MTRTRRRPPQARPSGAAPAVPQAGTAPEHGRTDLAARLTDAAFAAGWRVVRGLPEPLARAAFRAGADLAVRRDGRGVRRLRANLRRVVPDAGPDALDALVRAGMRSYARYWCEAFRLPAMDRGTVLARMDPHVTGIAPLFEALEQGRGVVAALPHSGNWDLAGLWFVQTQARLGRPAGFTTVVERLAPESLFRRFVAYRESLGFEVLAAGDGAAVYRTLTRRLHDGGLVCLVADRDLTPSGIDVSFFGEPARLPSGPARLAAATGALLLPAFPYFTPDGWGVRLGDAIPVIRHGAAAPHGVRGGRVRAGSVTARASREEVAEATQALADAFAELIATAPQDWHMLQRVFTADARP